MLAYNKELLDNTLLVEEAEHLQQGGFINRQQREFIEAQLPAYNRHSNIFARVGLILLGWALYSACCSFFMLLVLPFKHSDNVQVLFCIYAVAGFLALELILIRNLKYYGHGMDDAFLISAQVNVLTFVGFVIGDLNHLTILFFTAFVVGVLCCLRYADRFSALMACLGLSCLIGNVCLNSGPTGRMLLPFVMMLTAAGVYYSAQGLAKQERSRYYTKCLDLCRAFGMLLFYVGGNYLVVRQAGELLLGAAVAPGEDIALAPLFYAFTFLTPLGYVYAGLKKKSRLFLWMGLLTLAFSVFSIRYYYHVMPVELALIAGGLVLFGAAWLALHKLKGRTAGLTVEQDKASATTELLNLEAIWLIEQHSLQPGTMPSGHTGAEPGGGQFGGAGSEGKF